MLEGLVAWVINTYVGEYFEDLNTDQLSVGLLQGEVELENLPLKKDAFNFLNYPIEIRSGFIGKIKLQIPLYRLHSEPWVIFIEKVFIVVGPVRNISCNEEAELKNDYRKKLACLEDHERKWKATQSGQQESNYYGLYSNWKSYSTSVLANIVENIQLNVKDVHIRYEDDTCCKDKQLACGLVIRSLETQSTDENWVPVFMKKETNDMTWKLAQLQGLSLYWDTNATELGNLPVLEMMAGMLKSMETCMTPDSNDMDKEYIVSSVDAKAHVKRNCSSEALKSPLNPRIICDIQLERIPLCYNQNQYLQMLQWEKNFNNLGVKWRNRHWRPAVPVSSCPRAWWVYAVSSCLKPMRPKHQVNDWDSLLQRARDLKNYHCTYHEYLTNVDLLTMESRIMKDELEKKLEVDVLLILREHVMDEILRKKTDILSKQESEGGGFLQWMFPSWIGWYSNSSQSANGSSTQEATTEKTELEEEILTVLNTAASDTLLKRDALFMQLNFCLSKGTFSLFRNSDDPIPNSTNFLKPVIELEFSDVFIKLETKPKTRSLLFDIKLGALYLRDRTFDTSHFPYIIAAQGQQEDIYFGSPQPTNNLFSFSSPKVEVKEEIPRWLFELIYEKNPQDVQCDYKLLIRTKPLDVICNLDLIQIIVGIFAPVDLECVYDHVLANVPSAASVRYEHFKEHTKAEFQQTWDRMLVGERKSKKEWSIQLEIAAPQIFIPENIFDPNTNVLIFVLGDLHVFNSSKERTSQLSFESNTLDEEEDFFTPCSTPEEYVAESVEFASVAESCKTSDLLLKGVYESYVLELKNMQVLVSSLKDSWKFAQLRGSSSLHILDRFSINIQIYRRMFLTEDPQWPSVVLIASLPMVTAHISEVKVGAVRACIEDLESYFGNAGDQGRNTVDVSQTSLTSLTNGDHNERILSSSDVRRGSLKKSFFLMMQFSVDQMSLDIQSLSQSVAELQVAGVKTCFSMNHSDMQLSLTVHSLLVADALQTYGPDFELLVASHKHVSMDNSSGKLMNMNVEDCLGPLSSPPLSQSPVHSGDKLPWAKEEPDEEALIFFEFKITPDLNGEELRSAKVKFNNLDIIANQETIIEIVGLLKRIDVGVRKPPKDLPLTLKSKARPKMEMFLHKDITKFEMTFNFRLLNVLLLRAMTHSNIAQKLATATVRNASIIATVGNSTEICGTLGEVQVLDLVTEGTKFQKVISLGKENVWLNSINSDQAQLSTESCSEALLFKIIKRKQSSEKRLQFNKDEKSDVSELDIFLRMASFRYTHSPHLLFELSCCASEFKSYLKSLAYSIKSAAAEMAKGIVTLHSVQLDRDAARACLTSLDEGDDHLLNISCNIFMESPIIVLPHSTSSPEVFMAHLGHIGLRNESMSSKHSTPDEVASFVEDILHIDVSGMSVYHVNIENDVSSTSHESMVVDGTFSIDECSRYPILHDTAIEITVCPFQEVISSAFGLTSGQLLLPFDCDNENSAKTVTIKSKVASPLNVDCTKQHYEQLLKLLSNISEGLKGPPTSACDLSNESILISPVQSAESSFSSHITFDSAKRFSSPITENQFLICASLALPCLNIELKEYMNERESLISLTFQEFSLLYEQISSSQSHLQATLSSLLMENLQESSNTDKRGSMMVSSNVYAKSQVADCAIPIPYISASYPDIRQYFTEITRNEFSSLPDNLCMENVFSKQSQFTKNNKRLSRKEPHMSSYPNTPPPSPSNELHRNRNTGQSDNALVSLNVLILYENSNDTLKAQKKSFIVDMDFNSLDIVFNLNRWNIVFDFLSTSISEKEVTPPPENNLAQVAAGDVHRASNNDINFNMCVNSLTVVLSRPEYDLASVNISDFRSQHTRKADATKLDGTLGSLSVLDLTPMGRLYSERIVTTGNEMLQFSICSKASQEEFEEVCISANMSSITYVHTQRLIIEIMEFFQYFYDKRHSSKETYSQNVKSSKRHDLHLKLDMTAHSPIIILPSSALSDDSIVIRLQSISLKNVVITEMSSRHPSGKSSGTKSVSFKKQKTSATQDTSTLLSFKHSGCTDVISIMLNDVALYAGKRRSIFQDQGSDDLPISDIVFKSYIVSPDEYLLKQSFDFHLQIERDICMSNHLNNKVAEIKIGGNLSSVHVTLDLEKYLLIRSILRFNFGEALEEVIYDPCKEIEQFVLLNVTEEASTTMSWSIQLSNVILELCTAEKTAKMNTKRMLARFDFIKSHLSYVVFSNNRKDIDLFSNEIRIFDVRYEGCPANACPNVFSNILFPTKEGTSSTLQAELHYRMKNDSTKVTILLNNMKVMGIMDFIKNTLDFLCSPLPSQIDSSQHNDSSKKGNDSSMEFKLNLTNTEFVVVEDTSGLDSNAVIAKGTAVIVWKPQDDEKPVSFNLQQFEMFSCILGIEDDTALSIIDPVNFSIDLVNRHHSPLAKLQSNEGLGTLEVSATNLYMRFSYYDLMMFIKILESLKRQIGATRTSSQTAPDFEPGKEVKVLADIGFSVSDCQKALRACNGNLTDSALWLTQNAVPLEVSSYEPVQKKRALSSCESIEESNSGSLTLFAIELRLDSIGLCIIDDCREADVPVVELHFMDVNVSQKLKGTQEGFGMFGFSMDYYNCSVSGWEPLIEPWKCQLKWNMFESYEDLSKKLYLNMTTDDIVNINMTSAFIKLFKMVKDNWTEDYSDRSLSNTSESSVNSHTRSDLMPFVLRNRTGCKLWFATQMVTSNRFESGRRSSKSNMTWTSVENWETASFTFGKRVKLRHQDSHQETLHQIVVRIEGWQTVQPVCVDRVGVYFRNIIPSSNYFSTSQGRILFKIKLESNTQKSVTIESALSVTNKLEHFLEVKLDYPGNLYGAKEELLYVSPTETLPVPLPFIHSQIWVRPSDQSVAFSDLPVQWYNVTKPGEVVGFVKLCNSNRVTSKPYRLCVCVRHGNYPEGHDAFSRKDAISVPSQLRSVPGHHILVLPCLTVHSLLPCDLNFFIPDVNVGGCLKPGKKQAICNLDISKSFSFGVSIENFNQSGTISIYSASRHCPTMLELRDTKKKLLHLQLQVVLTTSAAVQLIISAPYWFVNKTGLPLIFKQEGTQTEAAGQFEEHELARCMAPLLFSFYDDDASVMCSMRVGKGLHPGSLPLWCSRFRLEKGIQVRRLQVARNDSRPDWVYNLGIEVAPGKGKYKDTNIITLSPRYQLDNRSKYKLDFCQKFAINEHKKFVLSAVPGCNFPFHWPRIDLDNLLCIRITDIHHCHWSGGFSINCIKSFFINMRDADGISHFLQTEIVLHGATYYVIFTNANSLPPPIRIDNHSEVSVTYYQTNVSQERLKTTVRPHSSVPYALDEPMLPPYITCSAPGGSLATYNMDIFREGSQLFYENFIYVAFTSTFPSEENEQHKSTAFQLLSQCTDEELVLDVPSGTRVYLSKKETGKRSQLWRMTSGEMLQHEGSSPPCDFSKSLSPSQNGQKLVLDIAAIGPQPQEFIPLMLRKPDARRRHTQTWRFTADGRLCCGFPNMYVQVKNGCLGLKAGAPAFLGPVPQFSSIINENEIPVEQAVCRQKLRGGCGVLSVRVLPDGPTRVLKICDLKQKVVPINSPEYSKSDMKCSPSMSDVTNYHNVEEEKPSKNRLEVHLNIKLSKGVGLSIINHLNEDLAYVMMHDIMIEFTKNSSSLMVDGSFKSIQVDNQLRETNWPVFLFVAPSNKTDSQRHLPAVHFTLHYIKTLLRNAQIFKHFIVTLKNLTVHLEEYLVFKLLQFCGIGTTSYESEDINENNNELQSSLFRHVTSDPRYYFSTLKLALQQVRLSVHTTDHLSLDLQYLKNKLGLRLISFEDAAINLDPFLKVHPFETAQFLIESIGDHYKQELKSQAAKIFGAVDFLGNPVGLINDVSDGLSELIHEGNVGGLIKNVAHGISDSAAKISETLSDGLGSVTIGEKHQMMRRQIRQGPNSGQNGHLMAGFQGLGIGLLGGFTSIFTETYEGATHEGIQGLLSGFGKGLVGTVAKPAVGLLDLASGAASAVRDTSKRSSRLILPHRRPPRMTVGLGALLPTYSLQQALDQELLYSLNNKNYSELFVAKEVIRSKTEDLQVLVSSEKVYFLNASTTSNNRILLIISLGDLLNCCYMQSRSGSEIRHYIQLHTKDTNSAGIKLSLSNKNFSLVENDEWSSKKPQVRCDSGEVAEKAVMQINYAKNLYEGRRYILLEDEETDGLPFKKLL